MSSLKPIKIKLSRVAINRAIAAQDTKIPPRVSQSCPIFQALQIHFKGRVEDVAYSDASLKNGTMYHLDAESQEITKLDILDWSKVKPIEFTITSRLL